MKKILIAFLVLIVIAVLATILFRALFYSDAIPVRVVELQLVKLQSSIGTNGKIEADKIHELRSPFSGSCRNILVQAGDVLKSGQSILSIEDLTLQPELASARAELEAAKVDFQNIERGPTKEELNQVEAEIARLRLDLDNAKKVFETNQWLLKRDAVSRFDADQSRFEAERLQQQLDAATMKRKDIQSRYSEADRDRATARVEAARARIRFLEGNLFRSVIRAPANGTLYHFELKSGAYVNAGDLIGLVADLSQMRVRAFVDEPELGQVSLGAEVAIRWDAHPQDTWKGLVHSIPSEVVTRGTRSVAEVLCSIESPRKGLIPNVNVDVEIMMGDGPPVQALPRNAVFNEGKGQYVWTIRNGQAIRRTVEAVRGTSSLIEIKKGLSEGERVIIPGEAPMSEGMKVRVAEK